VSVRGRSINVDRKDARPAPHGNGNQRVYVSAEIARDLRKINRRAVDPVRVERPFLTDRADGKDWNAMPRERQSCVED
jgi:hypothetical protein